MPKDRRTRCERVVEHVDVAEALELPTRLLDAEQRRASTWRPARLEAVKSFQYDPRERPRLGAPSQTLEPASRAQPPEPASASGLSFRLRLQSFRLQIQALVARG